MRPTLPTAAGYLLAAIADAHADVLVRVKTGRGAPGLPVLRRHRDGSYRSTFGGKLVRVIDAQIVSPPLLATAAARTGW